MKKKLGCILLSLGCMLSLASPVLASNELKPAITNHSTQNGNGYLGHFTDGFGAHLVKTDEGCFRLENLEGGYDIYGNWAEGGLF